MCCVLLCYAYTLYLIHINQGFTYSNDKIIFLKLSVELVLPLKKFDPPLL